jgi:hypothetical protein
MLLGLRKILIICSLRSFSLHWFHILKWNLVYRFIVRISRSRSVLGTIESFLTELCPLDLSCCFHSFSSHWLHILKWNLIYRFIISISRSNSVLGTIESFLRGLCPLDLENSNNLHSPFIFAALVAHTEMKFGMQIYYKNIQVKFCFGYDRAIFDRVMSLWPWKIPIICSFRSFSLQRLTYWNEFGIQIYHPIMYVQGGGGGGA